MSLRSARILAAVVGVVAAGALSGCGLTADVFNPGVFSSFGIDPNTVIPSQGSIIVLFKNSTANTAVFFAFTSKDPLNLTIESRNFSVEVPPNDNRNEVVDCPVGLVSPGTLGADFTPDNIAATVGGTDITYAWSLISGRDFTCGDVIEVELTDNATFPITVRVIPAR